jgi:hypothetical protein
MTPTLFHRAFYVVRTRWIMTCLVLAALTTSLRAQTGGIQDLNFQAQSEFQPTIKDAVKFSDLPEIRDSVKRITDLKYGISSVPMFPKYQVQPIDPAKMQNEPLDKLYRALLKAGYGPIYNMPYAEAWISSLRSRESNYGAHYRHLSSSSTLSGTGYSGFAENAFDLSGKKFYKKHTLAGVFNFQRHLLHYYGYDTELNQITDRQFTRQRYQLVEPKVMFTSHHSDSMHMNNHAELGFYNYTNLHREAENNVRLDASANIFINREKLNVSFLTDYYNHKQASDTLDNLILSLSPSFEAGGRKWHADLGLTGTLDNWKNNTRFYFYPVLNLHYDVYESLVIPYIGVNGGLMKNSLRRLSTENPFVDTTLTYANTNKKYDLFGGLRGNLSSNTSYDARVSYAKYDRMHFYVIDYDALNLMHNRFRVIYDDASLLTVSGELKYRLREKFNVAARAGYYMYTTDTLKRAYHKPEYDLTLSGTYNLKSKIILRAELYLMGEQWALTQVSDGLTQTRVPKRIGAWADVNLEAEYRYSRMLSFFARMNNLSNQRYYRWERYPMQRFGFMIGLTFVPF